MSVLGCQCFFNIREPEISLPPLSHAHRGISFKMLTVSQSFGQDWPSILGCTWVKIVIKAGTAFGPCHNVTPRLRVHIQDIINVPGYCLPDLHQQACANLTSLN